MFMPTVVRDDWFDDFMWGFPEFRPAKKEAGEAKADLMRTDIKETEEGFTLYMDLPGFAKEDVKAQIKDGYLMIEAENNSEKEEKDEEGKFLRRERFSGRCRRSFYVGENVTESDISASFKDGVLTIGIPKKQPQVEEPKFIAIEG